MLSPLGTSLLILLGEPVGLPMLANGIDVSIMIYM
jgi:hypothetical protein